MALGAGLDVDMRVKERREEARISRAVPEAGTVVVTFDDDLGCFVASFEVSSSVREDSYRFESIVKRMAKLGYRRWLSPEEVVDRSCTLWFVRGGRG